MIKLLREFESRPDTGKTIIFSEFVKMLDVVAGILEEERIRFVRCKLPPISRNHISPLSSFSKTMGR